MAGADSTEVQDAFVAETVVGTTPATPSFLKSSFDLVDMSGNPRISEAFSRAARGERSAIGRNGFSIAGSCRGKLIYGEYDLLWQSLFQGSWSSDILINGKSQSAVTVEQAVPQGAGGTTMYTRFRGVEAVTGRLELVAGQDTSVNFDLIGAGRDAATTTPIAGATYADPTVTEIIGSGSDIGTITMTGLTLDCINRVVVDFGVVGKEEQPRVSSDDPCGISRGTMRPRIEVQFYVEANALSLFNEAAAASNFALTIPMGSTTNQKYQLFFPSCEFIQSKLTPREQGAVFIDGIILPIYDSGIGGTARLTRAIA